MKKILEKISGYDYFFIDCPPALGLLTINGLVAADSVIVPLQCEFFALEGLSALTNTIESIKNNFNPTLEIEGVVLTMHDKRNLLSELVENDVRDFFGDKVLHKIRAIYLKNYPNADKNHDLYKSSDE